MDYEEILNVLSPCGLNCKKCFAFNKGNVKKHSIKLRELLGNFKKYAKRFSKFLPIFKKYNSFSDLLEYFTKVDCKGCRNGDCKYPNCGVINCYMEKKVDFCFECEGYPCNKTNFDPDLKQRWIQMNNRMKEIGVKAYYEEIKDLPRYR